MQRLGSQVKGGPPQHPAPGAQQGHTGQPAREFCGQRSSPRPGVPLLSSESCSQVHMPLWLSPSSCFQSIRLSLIPKGDQPCMRGAWVCQLALSVPQYLMLWWEQSPFHPPTPLKPAPCSTEKQVGPQASTGHGLTWTKTTWVPVPTPPPHCPLGFRAPCLGWDREGRSPLPEALENHRPQWLE